MQSFFITLNQLAVLATLGSVGYYIKKKKYITDSGVSALSFILLNVCMPAIILSTMQRQTSPELLKMGLYMIAITIAAMFLGCLVSLLLSKLFKLTEKERKVWIAGATLFNGVFIGLPIIEALYGEESVFYICFGAIAFNIVSYSFIPILFSEKGESGAIKEKFLIIIKAPAIIACALGLIIFGFGIKTPSFLAQVIDSFSSMTTPIAMIIMAALVSESSLKEIFADKKIYLMAAIRLIVIPLVALPVFTLLLKEDIIRNTIVMSCAMPIASSTPVFAERYAKSGTLCAQYCVVTTILSLITLPCVAVIVAHF